MNDNNQNMPVNFYHSPLPVSSLPVNASSALYETWFGMYTHAQHAIVQDHFAHIAAHNFTRLT